MDKDLKNKIKGTIYGLVVGDCLGAYLEFTDKDNHEYITDYKAGGVHRLRAGDWTDDTAMALAVIDSLIQNNGKIAPDDIMNKWADWYEQGKYSSNGKCFDIGCGTLMAIRDYFSRRVASQQESKGNGSIMRLAPTVILDYINGNWDCKASLAVSNLTHNNKYVQDIVKTMCTVIFDHFEGVKTDIQSCYKNRREVSNSGLAGATLNSALWAFHSTNTFEEGLIAAVNLGGDSDSIGAVYGQIAGAYYGYNQIPDRWKNGIVDKIFIDKLTNGMMEILEVTNGEK